MSHVLDEHLLRVENYEWAFDLKTKQKKEEEEEGLRV